MHVHAHTCACTCEACESNPVTRHSAIQWTNNDTRATGTARHLEAGAASHHTPHGLSKHEGLKRDVNYELLELYGTHTHPTPEPCEETEAGREL